jgi:xanthine dehydrogenase YagS FAD-binding subunit
MLTPFEYARPSSKEEAVKLLGKVWGDTEVLAGGTDLLSLIKDGAAAPRRLVSLNGIQELKGIDTTPSGVRIGALVTFDELISNAEVRKQYPAIVAAAEGVHSLQIRSVGTVGGDLCQRPRCWYYRNGYGLLAQQGGKSLAKEGDNRYHAILGNEGPAAFVNPSSLAPILIALGAKVQIHGPSGGREVELARFYVTPKTAAEREYALKPNEIVTGVVVPPAGGAKMAVYEVRQKEALDWPLAAAAVVLNMSGNTVSSARVVLGHVAPVPWPAPEAEQALAGKSLSETVAADAGKAAVSKATPLSMNAYKVKLASVAVKRAVLAAAKGGA